MRLVILVISLAGLFLDAGCRNTRSATTSRQDTSVEHASGIEGRVYSVGAPAVPIDWQPPPLEKVSTIVVLDSSERSVREVMTDEKGRFRINLPPGVYFLMVKESFIQKSTGPFEVRSMGFTDAFAHFDSGVR